MEKQADIFDQSSETESRFREQAIQAARAVLRVPADFDGEHCYTCGEEIEPGRLKLGMYRCYSCQVVLERKMKGL